MGRSVRRGLVLSGGSHNNAGTDALLGEGGGQLCKRGIHTWHELHDTRYLETLLAEFDDNYKRGAACIPPSNVDQAVHNYMSVLVPPPPPPNTYAHAHAPTHAREPTCAYPHHTDGRTLRRAYSACVPVRAGRMRGDAGTPVLAQMWHSWPPTRTVPHESVRRAHVDIQSAVGRWRLRMQHKRLAYSLRCSKQQRLQQSTTCHMYSSACDHRPFASAATSTRISTARVSLRECPGVSGGARPVRLAACACVFDDL